MPHRLYHRRSRRNIASTSPPSTQQRPRTPLQGSSAILLCSLLKHPGQGPQKLGVMSTENCAAGAGGDDDESYIMGRISAVNGVSMEGMINAGDVQQDMDDADDDAISSQPLVPYVGMTFDSVDDARQFYNAYAFRHGFGIRTSVSKNSQAKGPTKLISRTFTCVHARPDGSKSESDSTTDSIATESSNNSKRPRLWMNMADTRKMNRLQQKVSYRSHRKIPREDLQMIRTLHERNLSTSDCMGILGDCHGGDQRRLGYVKRDVSNARSEMRQTMAFQDMAMTIEYFERRQAESPQFFYATQVNKETNALEALFWVDGRTRALYPKYKDCVFFDTTFCTNKYNIPFAPIVGINNHLQTIVLGCALLPNEQIETFKWVFRQWLLVMNEYPTNLMTDQCRAMETAISDVFPHTVHRCCKWHVQRKAREKLGRMLTRDSIFEKSFYECINESETVDEFEETWQHMLHCFEYTENRHLQNMWECHQTWAPAYFKNDFFPFTSTTGRSEGLNSYFKTLVHPQNSVFTFVRQYELLQETMLDRGDNAAFTGETTTSPLWGKYKIERQAINFYTRSVFGKFQEQVAALTAYIINQVPNLEQEGIMFELYSNLYDNPKLYHVHAVIEEGLYSCSFHYFEMNGVLCSHIIRVMIQINVQEIPSRYMLERWSEAATTNMDTSGRFLEFGLPETNTLKYNSLCRDLNALAAEACSVDPAYNFLTDVIKQLWPIVASMKKDQMSMEEVVQQQQPPQASASNAATGENQQSSAPLQNPARVPKQGRPTERAKRKKYIVGAARR
ncbi:protein FAR1-RELATED SEQUENCE 5-like [Triticum urartu]|uniref:protein FAR1-RELATED SEQUENCE 5-like n=1 Tax=Triticum urartu TaxID=4572 RepID=UPI0020443929|nr:protein FAR1-RELATED SEQUENCE 5-like [Triticum urartu]